MVEELDEVSRDFINKAAYAAQQRFRDAVKPIYGATSNGKPEHIGSAFLLELREGCFLLTAAHVIDWNKSSSIYIGTDDELGLLSSEAFVSAALDGNRKKDHFDFAIIRLEDKMLGKLSNSTFVTESEISHEKEHIDGRIYTCLGYPNSRNRQRPGRNVSSSMLSYTDVERPATQLPSVAAEENHILVNYNSKYSRNQRGEKVSSTAIRGCSGGAIIEAGRFSNQTLNAAPDPKVAALLIEAYVGEKVILGVRLTTILSGVRWHWEAGSH